MLPRYFIYLLVFAISFLALAAPARALTVQTIRGAATADKTRLVFELDAISDFRTLITTAPATLIVELPAKSVTDRAGMGLGPLGVLGVRQTRRGGLMRLEFSLKHPSQIISAFMLPKDGEKPNRLVIDYRSCVGECPATAPIGTIASPSPEQTTPDHSSPEIVDNPLPTGQDPAADLSSGPRVHTVVIDAGHGGKDPGAIGVNKTYEKNITLAAAKSLAELLEESGRYRVVMTRSTDRFILLYDRVKIARAANADLFISLHADMAPENKNAAGLSVYTLSDQASDAQTEKLAAQENKVDLLAGVDLSSTEQDVTNILIDLAMRENMNQSRFLANKVVTSMNSNAVDMIQKPHRYAGFAVLKAPDIPSILVEMGFISNPREARRLQEKSYRHDLMRALKTGVDAYFKVLEKR